MTELFSGVSWLAVISGAVVSFLIGWLWYSPAMFGKGWAAGVGVELGSAKGMPVVAMAAQALGLFLMSWFVGVTAVSNALFTVILATVAFAVLAYSGGAFRGNSAYARAVDTAYWILSLVIMIAANGVF